MHLLLVVISVLWNIEWTSSYRNLPSIVTNDALHKDREFVNITGNIKLGALVALYDAGGQNSKHCKRSGISSFGMQRVEAMKFAINKINKNSFFNNTSGLKLGIEIRDSCGSETRALDETLHFVTDRVPMCQEEDHREQIFGVVGASMSLLTAAVANLLRLFQIPLISYAATSTELSEEKYDFLLRTVPPDQFQSEAMVDFIADVLGWKSVFVIYSVGSYGEYGFKSFFQAVEKRRREKSETLCIVESEKVSAGISQKEMRQILSEFHDTFKDVIGIVCYCEIPDVTTLVKVMDSVSPNFRLIGSDTTLSGAKTNKSIIFSLAYDEESTADFYREYQKLTPTKVKYKDNPWFHKFWNESCLKLKEMNPMYNDTDCSNETVFGFCRSSPIDTYKVTCEQDDKIPYTIDAVYAYAHAIRNVLNQKYNKNVSRLINMDLKNRKFFDLFLKNVEFAGSSGNISFNESADRGAYDIIQFRDSIRNNVGTWKEGRISVDDETQKILRETFLNSTCQPECSNREEKVKTYKTCCWTCKKCKKNEYKVNDTCKECEHGKQPNRDFSGCDSIPIEHIGKEWKYLIGILSSLGVLCTLLTIKCFIQNNDTPLVKASGRELTYLLLVGILMLFFTPLLMILEPNEILCGISRFNFGIFLCLCYGSLLVKTNRIARIFTGKQDLLFLTPNWQLILVAFIMMPQILITSIGLVTRKGNGKITYIDYEIVTGKGFRMCRSDTFDLYGTLVWNIILVILCTYYAFITRKVPANFNESRFIGFVMYTTIVIWCAFLPVYFGISSQHRIVFLMLDHILNAMTLLIGLFGMKMYILVLRPDKNSRHSSKLRSVTFFSEGDSANGTVHLDGISNGLPTPQIGQYKTITDSPSFHEQNSNHVKPNHANSNGTIKTQTEDRGTSMTVLESKVNRHLNDLSHEPLHKTFTL